MQHPALDILRDMVAIQSVNPDLEAGGRGEADMAAYIEERCRRLGMEVQRQNVLPGRDNLIVALRRGKGATLLLESHLDTASLGSQPDPLTPREEDGLLYGRGSCDTKGTTAGMLYAMEEAARHPEQLTCDLVFCGAIDEEYLMRGINAFCDMEIPVQGAVVGEPTALRIIVAHKGFARFAVTTQGRAAHSSVPREGNSAIYQMMEVLRFVRDEYEPALARMTHPLVGEATIVAGTIQGGTQVNIVPEKCEVQFDRRVLPGETAEGALEHFATALTAAMAGRGVDVALRPLILDPALDTARDSAITRCAAAAAAELGLDSTPQGVPYGTDASKLHERCGIPTIVFGPGDIARAHTANEYVPVREVAQAAAFYTRLTRTFTG